MNKLSNTTLIIATAILTLIAGVLIVITVAIGYEYWGIHMANEAYGLYSFCIAATLVTGIPTFLLWRLVIKNRMLVSRK